MSPMSGPIGTPIEVTVKAGWRTMESTWVVNGQQPPRLCVGRASKDPGRALQGGGPAGMHVVKLLTDGRARLLEPEQSPVANCRAPSSSSRRRGRNERARRLRGPYQPQRSRDGSAGGERDVRAQPDAARSGRASWCGARAFQPAALSASCGNLRRHRSAEGLRTARQPLPDVTVGRDGRLDATPRFPMTRRPARCGDSRGRQGARARVLRDRDEHRLHLTGVRARGTPVTII